MRSLAIEIRSNFTGRYLPHLSRRPAALISQRAYGTTSKVTPFIARQHFRHWWSEMHFQWYLQLVRIRNLKAFVNSTALDSFQRRQAFIAITQTRFFVAIITFLSVSSDAESRYNLNSLPLKQIRFRIQSQFRLPIYEANAADRTSMTVYLALDWIYIYSNPSVSSQSAQSQAHINFALGQYSQSCDKGVPKTASKTPKTMRGKIIFLFAAKKQSRFY